MGWTPLFLIDFQQLKESFSKEIDSGEFPRDNESTAELAVVALLSHPYTQEIRDIDYTWKTFETSSSSRDFDDLLNEYEVYHVAIE